MVKNGIRDGDLYLSGGNVRMNIPTWSIPAIDTCPAATEHCKRYCYAKKAENIWRGVRPSRDRNYRASLSPDFVDRMVGLVGRAGSEYIRIHESGDFYSQEYLDKWFEVARRLPDVSFLAFSQCFDLDWSEIPPNIVRYWTVWDDTSDAPPPGLIALVKDDGSGKIGEPLGAVADRIPNTIKMCIKGKGVDLTCEQCLWCYKGKGDIVFKLH